ncbi:MAG: glycine oxidase ThiO [Gemmatimonadetes bacterium]|nr:glycine oxidase ThiO [Gemmatimonadota bacterium]
MSLTADVLVIGGGIAGLTSALAAAECGLNVVVVDATRPGAASVAAAGMLAPSVEGMPGRVRFIALDARDLYPAFLASLKERTGIDVPLDRNGIIELATTPEHRTQLFATADGSARQLDEHALARFEPALAGHAGGLFSPLDGSVDNVVLMCALDRAVERAPRIKRISAWVESVDFSRAEPTTTTSDGSTFSSSTVLLASGAWTSIAGLPRPIPVRPLHGQLLRLDAAPVTHVTYGCGGYLIPRGRSVVIGATTEDTGFETRTTHEGRAALLAIARAAVPGLEKTRVLDHWSGLRPVSPDTLPILGPDPECGSLVYACGFSRNGILLAPWAAKATAGILAGERSADALHLFTITRFKPQ